MLLYVLTGFFSFKLPSSIFIVTTWQTLLVHLLVCGCFGYYYVLVIVNKAAITLVYKFCVDLHFHFLFGRFIGLLLLGILNESVKM